MKSSFRPTLLVCSSATMSRVAAVSTAISGHLGDSKGSGPGRGGKEARVSALAGTAAAHFHPVPLLLSLQCLPPQLLSPYLLTAKHCHSVFPVRALSHHLGRVAGRQNTMLLSRGFWPSTVHSPMLPWAHMLSGLLWLHMACAHLSPALVRVYAYCFSSAPTCPVSCSPFCACPACLRRVELVQVRNRTFSVLSQEISTACP